MMDLIATVAGLLVVACVAVAFGLRGANAEYERVTRDGGSVLLDMRTMNAAYWALSPIVRACVRFGISANTVTLASLALGFGAGVLLAFGHFGLAAVTAGVAALGDAVDGLVARETATASEAGEVLDSVVDRYCEAFFLGGLAIHYASSRWALALTLAATIGSFMVSYATAKAAALAVPAPRGAMRRAERAAYLVGAALLVPLTTLLADGRSSWAAELPMLGALTLVAVVANVSAVRRLTVIARGARRARSQTR